MQYNVGNCWHAATFYSIAQCGYAQADEHWLPLAKTQCLIETPSPTRLFVFPQMQSCHVHVAPEYSPKYKQNLAVHEKTPTRTWQSSVCHMCSVNAGKSEDFKLGPNIVALEVLPVWPTAEFLWLTWWCATTSYDGQIDNALCKEHRIQNTCSTHQSFHSHSNQH